MSGVSSMLYNFCYLFLMFLIYSIIGYIVEIIFCTIVSKKLVFNRGFLIGPYLPIYGLSSVLMYTLLIKYESDPIALFVMSCILCSIMEFFTSLILEKIFKVRWWDYSHMKFNLDGRICLSNSILFGIGGLAIVYVINPVIMGLLDKLPSLILIIISLILLTIFISDLITSVVVLVKIKTSSIKFSQKDVSEELTKIRNDKLKRNSFLFTRLLNAFPKMSGKNMEKYVELKKKVNEIREKRRLLKKEAKQNKRK